jgi:hypothetical protein
MGLLKNEALVFAIWRISMVVGCVLFYLYEVTNPLAYNIEQYKLAL